MSLERVRDAHATVADLEAAAEPTALAVDRDDVGWRNRRRLAARQILEVLETEQRDPAALLPVAADLDPDPFRNANASLLSSAIPSPASVVQARFLLSPTDDGQSRLRAQLAARTATGLVNP